MKDLTDNREPFKVNDRVSHNLFGKGTVEKVSSGSCSKYHHIDVVFDEPYQVRDTAPSTRYRRLVSTYLEKLDEEASPEQSDALPTLNLEGLEDTGLVALDFSSKKN